MKKVITPLIIITALSTAFADEETKAYFCIPDYSTGFKLENKKWQPAQFSVDEKKHILKINDKSEWKWFPFAGLSFSYECTNFNEDGQLACRYYGTDIRFNRQTLRFAETNMGGYVSPKEFIGTKHEKESPYVEIGKCTAI